jgi:kynurenine formamidase
MVDQLIVPIAVISLQSKVAANDDYMMSVADITDWESKNGKVKQGCVFVMNTGWYKKFSNPQTYVNQDKEGVLHFPGFSPAAAKLLVERQVAGIGIEIPISKLVGKWELDPVRSEPDKPGVIANVVFEQIARICVTRRKIQEEDSIA